MMMKVAPAESGTAVRGPCDDAPGRFIAAVDAVQDRATVRRLIRAAILNAGTPSLVGIL